MTFDIAGAKGSKIDPEAVVRTAAEWASSRGAEVCLLDARSVFGRDHLQSAAFHAIRAREARTMSSRSVAMETLLYAAGARQVQDAIRSVGLRQDTTAIGVVLFGPAKVDEFIHDMGWSRDDGVLDAEGKSLEHLGISDREAETVSNRQGADLVLEKVALLDVEK
jgi:KEOPS complex subunit Cgi121